MRSALLLLAVLATAHGGPPPPIQSDIWPHPVNFTKGSTALELATDFGFMCTGRCPDPLTAAFARYQNIIFFAGTPQPPQTSGSQRRQSRVLAATAQLHLLRISVVDDLPLTKGVDESYTLTVPEDGTPASLTAVTQWGALRGLESFAQLVIWQGPDDAGRYVITSAPVAVVDAPRFPIRGLLIDTSFNFLTVNRIKDVLDSAAVMKANMLHWHILDDPAWPMQSTTFPAFTAPGNNGPYASVAVYTPAQQAEIAQYAWERGVMILLEADLPGHCASWGAGDPNLVISCPGGQTLINPVGEPGQSGTIYDVLFKLFKEFYGRIGSKGMPWLHLGGDEVDDYSCWLQSPAVQAWAKGLNISMDPLSLRTAFTQRLQIVADTLGLRPMFWEETFNGDFGARPDSIITPWVTPADGGRAVAASHDVLIYVGYYLDQWVPPARTDGWYMANVSYGYIDSLNLLYAFDPITSTGVPQVNASRVLGGVASAWGDQVDSSNGATGMLYPRGLAVGEKLWSPQSFTALTDPSDAAFDAVQARVENARCKLVQRGIAAGPVGIAGDYGLCWIPEWGVAGGGPLPVQPDTVALTSGQIAGIAIGSALAGASLVGAFLFRRSFSTSMSVILHDITTSSKSSGSGGSGGKAVGHGSSSSSRLVALDQLRGLTMVCMLFVNLYYGLTMLPPFFSHGITYFSGPDLIEPCFHFCVGAALRLTLQKRLAALEAASGEDTSSGTAWWRSRWALFWPMFKTRVLGLIILSMFFSEGWGQFDSWTSIGGFGPWLTALVQSNKPYHTLLHIAFITVWTFLPMTMSWRVRAVQLVGSALIHITLHATFYFRWIKDYDLDEGGYFAFFGWCIEALVGSFAYDIITHYSSGAVAAVSSKTRAADTMPLLSLSGSSASPGSDTGSSSRPQSHSRRQRMIRAAQLMFTGSVALMLLAYLLSCLGSVAPLTVCYDGTRIFFWGGFGDLKDCALLPTYGAGGFFVAPPFYLPDPATNVVTMWTMTQRAGSVTYHLFGAGTSLCFLSLLYALCEVGIPAPGWWYGVHRIAARVTGMHYAAPPEREEEDHTRLLVLRWHVLELLGENALAVYLIGDMVSDNIGDMIPPDCPAWYFVLWGEGLYIGVTILAASYLKAHKLFLRL